MKRILLCMFLTAFLPKANLGQILNSGFENWTGGDPDHWSTSNIPGSVTNVSSNTDAHSGSMSARGEVVSFTGTNYPPLLSNTTTDNAGSGVDHRVVNLTMWIKFHSVSNDELYIVTTLTKQTNSNVGAISITIPSDVTEWSQLILPYKYIDPINVPDTMTVALSIAGKPGPNPHIGSWFEVDDVVYSDEPSRVHLSSAGSFDAAVFPNPVNSQSTIRLTLPERSTVSAAIYDVVGREIQKVLVVSFSQGSYLLPFQREGAPDGIYYLKITAGGNTKTIPVVFSSQ
jgi:hypothetical protein